MLGYLERLNIEQGFIQELEAERDYLPDFRKCNPFPPNLGRTLRRAAVSDAAGRCGSRPAAASDAAADVTPRRRIQLFRADCGS